MRPALPPERDLIEHVLLDRDGVLALEPEQGWTATIESWLWEDGALDALDLLAAAGVAVSVVTNQSGVGRGMVQADAVERLHDWLTRQMQARGVNVVGVFCCPHEPELGCRCRKPAPGLVRSAVYASGTPADRSVLIGDAPRDVEAALAAGVRAILVRTGKGCRSEVLLPGVEAYDNVAAAVQAVWSSLASRTAQR